MNVDILVWANLITCIDVVEGWRDIYFLYEWFSCRSKMTLNYRIIMERYPFPNGVVGGSIPIVKSSLYLTKEFGQAGRKPRAHPLQGMP